MSIKLFLNAIRIFNKRDKAKIVSISIIQIGLNILDLAGVVLIGLVGALAINGTSSRPPGDRVQTVLNFLNLDKFNLQTQVTYIAILASLILVIKTVFSVYFTRKILFFLKKYFQLCFIQSIDLLTIVCDALIINNQIVNSYLCLMFNVIILML
jgi:hypothetical protein